MPTLISIMPMVLCPWSWWNLQYLLLSLLSTGVLIGFGHYGEGSSLICIRTCLIGIIRGVKLMNLGFLSRSSFFFPMVCPTLRVSFFLLRLPLVPSSLLLFPFISFASTTSFAFICFWALWSNFVTIFGGFLVLVASLLGMLLRSLDLQLHLPTVAPY